MLTHIVLVLFCAAQQVQTNCTGVANTYSIAKDELRHTIL
jgi:hypothetical protein